MSISTIILGESGSGKTASLRNLNPKDTMLIQSVKKPIPFKAEGWAYFSKENPKGNIFTTDQSEQIIALMHKTRRKVICLMISNTFWQMNLCAV